MIQSKAQTVASALIGLGFTVKVIHDNDDYTVIVEASVGVDVTIVSTFVTNQGISGTVTLARLN
jgi:hypothetical protein